MSVRKIQLFIKSSQDIQQVTQRERTDELSLNRTQDYDNCTHQHSQKPDQRFERLRHVKPCLLNSQFICFHIHRPNSPRQTIHRKSISGDNTYPNTRAYRAQACRHHRQNACMPPTHKRYLHRHQDKLHGNNLSNQTLYNN